MALRRRLQLQGIELIVAEQSTLYCRRAVNSLLSQSSQLFTCSSPSLKSFTLCRLTPLKSYSPSIKLMSTLLMAIPHELTFCSQLLVRRQNCHNLLSETVLEYIELHIIESLTLKEKDSKVLNAESFTFKSLMF